MRCWILPLWLLIWVGAMGAAVAQVGPPPFLNFAPESYTGGPDNHAVVQDRRGLVYVANAQGVLEFDGASWRLITLPGRKPATTLAVSDSGRVYVGTDGDFGYLRPDVRGQLVYESLANGNAAVAQAGRVLHIYVYAAGVFFCTDLAVFRFDGRTAAPIPFAPGRTTVGADNLLLFKNKLCRFENNQVVPIRRNVAEVTDSVFADFCFYEPGHWAVAAPGAIYIYNGQRWRRVQTKADELLRQYQITSITPLETGGRYAVGTLRGGVMVLRGDGRLETSVNLAAGLLTETVHGLWRDNQDGLWLALEKGLARLELNAPVSRFGENEGLKGDVRQLARIFNNLYVATDRGLYMLSDNAARAEFRSVEGIVTGTHTLVSLGRNLWAVSGNGFFKVDADTATLVQPAAVGAAHRSRYTQGRVYYAGNGTFGVATLGADSASVRQWRLTNLPEVEQIDEDDAGAVILQTRRGIYRLYFPGNNVDTLPTFYNLTYAQPLPAGLVRMFRADGKLMFGTRRGLYSFSGRTGRFSADTSLGSMWAGRAIDYVVNLPGNRLLLNAEGRVWLGTPRATGSGYDWEPRVFARFPALTLTAAHTEGNARQPIVWLGAEDGLLRYDTRIQKNYGFDFLTQLRGVGLGPQDSLLFGGAFRGYREDYVGIRQDSISVEMSRLDNGFGRIRFTFAAPAFDDFAHNQYNFKLEGWDSTWSGWTSAAQVDYNNLPIGTYTFRVRGRNLYGTEGQEVIYLFEVLPLWYETTWATVLFIILGLGVLAGIVYAAVRYYGYRSRIENERLTRIVDERTAELRESNAQLGHANLQLAEQNDEISQQKAEIEADKHIIEEKNKEIEESIVYAFRIQTALLPAPQDIQAGLPNSFVFWRPKDIVSGDFFWYSQVEGHTLITAADCTGHGIPGAFMTMIGNTLLNEIVRRDRVIMPNEILERLHIGVRRALSQDKTQSRDGMDLVFLSINPAENKLYFAGANNPLIRVRNGEAENIKADKQAIGGSQDEDVRRFTLNTLDLEPGDTFYLSTDGFQDQFGGPKGKKYMSLKFREMLGKCSLLPITQQRDFLETEFLNWIGTEYEQVDDVLVIGMRWGG